MSPEPGRPLMTKGAVAPTIVMAKNDETEMKNVAAEQDQFAAWNMHDMAKADTFLTDDFILHDTTQPKDLNKVQNGTMTKGFWKAFSDGRITLSSTWAAGEYVFMSGTFNGTNDGDFPAMKIKKTGNKVSVPFIEIDRLEGGKIKEGWFFVDGSTLASQLAPAAKK